jgi:hypothetical protein
MLTKWNIPLEISGICQYSTYSMPFIVRSELAKHQFAGGTTLPVF